MLYYVGLPAAALFWGRDAIVSRLFGLQRLALPASVGIASTGARLDANWSDWVHDLGWAAALGLGLGALLLLAAFAHRRALFTIQCDVRRSNTPAWRTAREAVYREVHWAFYRNAPVVAFGSYWGTWAGLALVAFEAMINPLWREGLREPGLAWSRVSQGALLIVSSLLYLHTQNLWLALPVHWGISQVLEKVYTAPWPVPSDAVSSGK